MRYRSGTSGNFTQPLSNKTTCSLHSGHNYVSNQEGLLQTAHISNWEMKGSDLPNYHARVKAGELVPFGAYYRSETIQQGWVHWTSTQSAAGGHTPSQPARTTGSHQLLLSLPTAIESPVVSGDLVQSAVAKLYNRAWDSTTFLAELGQLISMFRSAASKIVAILSTKRYRSPGGLQYLSQDWLEGRYGWRTLMYDLQGISRALKSSGSANRQKRVSSIVSESVQTVNLTVPLVQHNGAVRFAVGQVLCAYQVRTKVAARGIAIADFMPTPAFRSNLVVTAWELVPFSFVLDWVWDVGQAIEAALANAQTGAMQTCFSTLTEQVIDGLSVGSFVSQNSFNPETFSQVVPVKASRIIRSRVPIVSPTMPQLKIDFSVLKGLDLFSIIVGVFRSPHKGRAGRYDSLW